MPALQPPAVSLLRPTTHRSWRDYRLIALDMDSTLLRIETLDVLAAAAGLSAPMAAWTAAAMHGEVADYAQDLQQRVAMLRGLPAQALAHIDVLEQLSPGAAQLIYACRQHGLYCMVISSGFSHYAEQIQRSLGMQAVRANVLQMEEGVLTGALLPQPGAAFVDRQEKQNALLHACAQLGITPAQAIAVGDGANDVAMLQAAGLGVAYHAKPVLRAQADLAIDHGGLEQLAHWLSAGGHAS